MKHPTAERLSTKTIVLFWLPLAATWFMMGVEGPYVAAIVARLPEAAHSLAAYGVAQALAWLIESPIMMLLSAATALVRDRLSYIALRRFAFSLNALVTGGMIVLSIPGVFRFVGEDLMGLPAEISRLAHLSTIILILWPGAIGYRRFYQGIMVRHHLTRRVAYGTVVRLVTMSITAAALAFTMHIPGAILAAVSLLSGVVAEAAASRWMARHIVRSLMESDEVAAGTLLTFKQMGTFYFPLALTSMLAMATGPLVTFGLAHGRAPIESLAVWPVIQSFTFLFRSGGIAFQEVGIALTGPRSEHAREVWRTGWLLGGIASAALALVALTPLERVYLQGISGLSPMLAVFARWPIRLLVLIPALDYLLSMQRSRWILSHRTRTITAATAIEAAALGLTLFAGIAWLDLVGSIAGAIAMVVGRLAANAFLSLRASRSEA